ncbi:MAG: efflux RND transporter periplasmic adaptor subunit [Bryobacteraceae bacterium]|nr:efflux RND transporter periplasmic adaptor subunit [Bryobacteraceae bacterium]
MKFRWIVVLSVTVLTVAGGSWWLLGRQSTEPATEGDWIPVERRDLISSVAAVGKINAKVGAEVRVGSRVSGTVERLHANIGDVVRAGQVIAELERQDQEALLAQRRAELKIAEARLASVESLRPGEIQKAEAALRDAEATAELARIEFERESALLQRGLIARKELDSARKEQEVTEARVTSAHRELELARQRYVEDLRAAKAGLEQAAAAVEVIDAQLSYATIRAPISGIVSSISTQEGETVAAGLNSPTFVTIIDLGRLQVDAFVDETDIGKIRVGQKATFTVDSFPDRDFHATVQAIYPKAVIMDNVVYYDVVLEIEESLTGELRPEMTTNVINALDARENVLTVPLRAVTREQGQSVVYVARDGLAVRQAVRAGWRDSRWVEILSGLEEGDQVLIRRTPLTNGDF